eukprot:CAMPEP_0180470412 /NCGR_PEP_ID=MMETSP1036_2-20121128/28570_1 /TAXON_ID=632150 /ORGANISM="Azadinium spinosum, Strain 3D9" /LENGTH=447 /DNA_ID=CAMNT_0022477541 /DNA_START=142 /DNA_END=1482 /DNA_ORIENTATION=-
MAAPSAFVDHYAAIGEGMCPDTPHDELKKVYFDMLRQYHPDKRPMSAGDTGSKITQALTEAWELLREPESRQAYDQVWLREKEAALPAHQRAEIHRRKGNEMYTKARALMKEGDTMTSLTAVQESVKGYKTAIEHYTKAAELSPYDHRLFSNRSLCYSAVEDWPRSRDDALQCTKLRPDFMKGWFLLSKALWNMGHAVEAQRELQNGLAAIPGCRELLELQGDISRGSLGEGTQRLDHSVSPAASRGPTPPGSRPVSPPLVAAGLAAAGGRQGRSPGPPSPASPPNVGARTYAGPQSSSRSPGAASRLPCPPSRGGPPVNLDASMSCLTGNFGAPTPNFASGMPPPHMANQQSYMPVGSSTARSGHSPGPSFAQTYGGPGMGGQSTSPGPSARGGPPGPDFFGNTVGGNASSRNVSPISPGTSPILRKSTSLRGLAETSGNRSRGPT